jgi:ATP-dependent DNA helicase PIF1
LQISLLLRLLVHTRSFNTDIGIAAVQIGGMTIHSFAGIGKGEDGIVELKKKIERSKRYKKHWTECKVLIIDEVSMVQPSNMKLIVVIGRFI